MIWTDECRTLSAASWLKVPLAARRNFLTSGGVDLSLGLQFSWTPIPSLRGHANLGGVLARDGDLFQEHIAIDNLLYGGLAAAYRLGRDWAVVGQVQAHTNAFRDNPAFSADVVSTTHLGLRTRWRDVAFEMSLGTGLGVESSNLVASFAVSYALSPCQGDNGR